MKRTLLTAAMLAIALLVGGCDSHYMPQEGDVAFESLPHNPLIDTIEGSTGSPFSHCGILHQVGTDWCVIEAIGPVKETALTAWEMQGRDGHFTVYRLKRQYRDKIPAFIKAAQGYEGRPYDLHYDMDDAAIYCSELIYKAFRTATGEELGHLQKLGELRWQPYEPVIKQLEGGRVPLERLMITPRCLSEAPQLEKVFEQKE
ncbi:MAG: YiiX/YebB-like N1pC/P60 family cysteine hydrolase [Chthoniobacter sp.]|nr:YiiX/YebB-like N1pC/P60 family cysteine hydrolase [Chthoniobacter sp.]